MALRDRWVAAACLANLAHRRPFSLLCVFGIGKLGGCGPHGRHASLELPQLALVPLDDSEGLVEGVGD